MYNLKIYLTNDWKFPKMPVYPKKLTSKEEDEAIFLYENGNKNDKDIARNILIERNMRLVAHIAKKYSSENTEDLISTGTIGLIKGVSSFDSKKGSKLSTYVAKCIENEILMQLRSNKRFNNEISMQDFIGSDREGNSATLEDKLADDIEPIDDFLSLKYEVKKLYELIEKELTQREKEIMEYRYGLNKKKELTQREIGELLNISRSYVSRIEKKCIKKLKEKLI